MKIYNLGGLISGLVILFLSIFAACKSCLYLRKVKTPLARKLSLMVFVSSVLATIGSISILIESWKGIRIWWVMAIFYTISYVLIISAIFIHLKLLVKVTIPESEQAVKFENMPVPRRSYKKLPLPRGGFTITSSQLRRIQPICKAATGKLYVGRSRKPRGCSDFDGSIWITRVEAPNAVDPTKLHVLQGKIAEFISKKGEGSLVVMEGIEHLALYNDFKGIMKFLASLKDYMLLANSMLLVVVDEKTLQDAQLAILKRELPPLDLDELLTKLEQQALFGVLSRDDLRKQKEKPKSDSSI